jgi:hypothetical protein
MLFSFQRPKRFDGNFRFPPRTSSLRFRRGANHLSFPASRQLLFFGPSLFSLPRTRRCRLARCLPSATGRCLSLLMGPRKKKFRTVHISVTARGRSGLRGVRAGRSAWTGAKWRFLREMTRQDGPPPAVNGRLRRPADSSSQDCRSRRSPVRLGCEHNEMGGPIRGSGARGGRAGDGDRGRAGRGLGERLPRLSALRDVAQGAQGFDILRI